MPKDARHDICEIPECSLPTEKDDEYCILHSEDPKKDAERFRSVLHGVLKGDTRKFMFVTFPGPWKIDGLVAEKPLEFFGSTFNGRVSISKCHFKEGCSFRHCTFKAELNVSRIKGIL